ncbi:MAG TPA: NAD(P)-dependent oxidoreductase [Burkholderiales bacterium]|nr:NAD(P)-dependent oxidoreductase [Burkholderiales bacterium]
MKIGFIGLGQMGRGMVSRLIEAGHQLVIWNRTRAHADGFATRGAVVAATPADTLATEVVISMLADDASVEAVWITAGLIQKLPTTTVHLNMASVSLRMGKRLDDLHRGHGSPYVSAPVFGRPAFAACGKLDIIAAGAPAAMARCEPLFTVLGRRWFNVAAEAPKANAVKVARNFLLATIIESLGESFALVEKAGVDPRVFFDIITSTAMNSPAYKNYGKLMLENPDNPSFPLKLGLKDVELALQTAADLDVPLPTAELMRRRHLDAIAQGYGERDWAALGTYIMDSAAGRINAKSTSSL